MSQFIRYFDNFGVDLPSLLWTVGLTLASSILLSFLGRMIFGKKSSLPIATSSAIGILFVYALNIALHCAGVSFRSLTSPLPFLRLQGSTLALLPMGDLSYTVFCGELTGLILLGFLMNIIDRLFPRGKHLITWLFFRSLSVVLAQVGYIAVNFLLGKLLPEGFLLYAPVIILLLVLLMLLTGVLKFIVGLFLTTVNPLIAAFYTFFFANVVGKQVTRAILSASLITGLFYLLSALGITGVAIAAGALLAYIPVLILLLILWYLLNKLF